MTATGLLWIALAIFVHALVARRLSNGILTPPMIFLALGLGAAVMGLGQIEDARHVTHLLAEATLVLVLFADASSIKLRALVRHHIWPQRMLLFGLPLAVLFGTFAGVILLPGWPFWEVALIAAILAPTDAALGQAVITNEAVPERARRALTVESGANDGFALPIVLFLACTAIGSAHDFVPESWLQFAAKQIGYGIIVGLALGAAGGLAVSVAARWRTTGQPFAAVGALALAACAYLAAIELDGNGFLSAFAAGLTFGAATRDQPPFLHEFVETQGQILVLGTLLLLGATLLPDAIAAAEPAWIAFILVSLFAVRPAAIWASLRGTDADRTTVAFLGWFGPRGLATALFALLVLEELGALTMREEILAIALLTLAISAVLHGISAAPGARWYARRAARDTPDGIAAHAARGRS